MIEAEVKLYLTDSEHKNLPEKLSQEGFNYQDTVMLQDYLFGVTPSPIGKGWNFTRLRKQSDNKIIETVKTWNLAKNGEMIREETEHEITQEEFTNKIKQQKPDYLITKERATFKGNINANPTTIAIDSLQYGKDTYYFIEAEVMTTPDLSANIRQMIKSWLIEALGVSNSEEAPSMIDFVQSLTISKSSV